MQSPARPEVEGEAISSAPIILKVKLFNLIAWPQHLLLQVNVERIHLAE